ncbi:ABC transporter substrate-binding protein [Nesterenkonia sp. NBAIMH1]|uniref:ABC transporter substrate-binding protein n=1 Tax=Nesterenkonia sp. NBAIMH1 TaxID=2600320 RepID=UPI0011B5C436|nr:ABC transporter substrate-binding protein [Nesterenkonia sp. NBAIMH1]
MLVPWKARRTRSLSSVSMAGLLLVGLLTGCSGSLEEADPQESDPGEAPAAGEEAGSAYPRTIEHEFGETVLEEKPERLVTLGAQDHDYALALGSVPVGNSGFTFYEDGIGPWAEEYVEDADLTFFRGSELQLEEVAALEPDVITSVTSELPEEILAQLEDIAPVIGRPSGPLEDGVTMGQAAEAFGQILDQKDQAADQNDRR